MKNGSNIDERWRRSKVHFVVIGVVMLFALALLAQNARFVELNADYIRLEKERHKLDEETTFLTFRKEQLRDPGRIRTLAVENLGMVPPDPERVHTLGELAPSSDAPQHNP